MKQIVYCYRNWRIIVVYLLSITAGVLGVAEADSLRVFFRTKLAAVILVCIAAALWARWKKNGSMQELNNLEDE